MSFFNSRIVFTEADCRQNGGYVAYLETVGLVSLDTNAEWHQRLREMDETDKQMAELKEYMQAYWHLVPKNRAIFRSYLPELPSRFKGQRKIMNDSELEWDLLKWVTCHGRSYDRATGALLDFDKAWQYWEPKLRKDLFFPTS